MRMVGNMFGIGLGLVLIEVLSTVKQCAVNSVNVSCEDNAKEEVITTRKVSCDTKYYVWQRWS